MTVTVPAWLLILGLSVWQLARVALSPGGQAILAAIEARIRGPKPPAPGEE